MFADDFIDGDEVYSSKAYKKALDYALFVDKRVELIFEELPMIYKKKYQGKDNLNFLFHTIVEMTALHQEEVSKFPEINKLGDPEDLIYGDLALALSGGSFFDDHPQVTGKYIKKLIKVIFNGFYGESVANEDNKSNDDDWSDYM